MIEFPFHTNPLFCALVRRALAESRVQEDYQGVRVSQTTLPLIRLTVLTAITDAMRRARLEWPVYFCEGEVSIEGLDILAILDPVTRVVKLTVVPTGVRDYRFAR